MDLSILLLLAWFSATLLPLEVEPKPISKITIMGTVFCDTCSNNTFSKHSYFLQGVEVHVECRYKANSTEEHISLSVNRTTNKYGVYTFEFPSAEGFKCREGHEIGLFCKARLLRSSSSLCNVPGQKRYTEYMAIKSKHENLCMYSLNVLNYKPMKRDIALCGGYKGGFSRSLNASEFFLPPFPPFGFPFPPIPQFPPFPPIGFPFPPLPRLPPLPQLPPLPPLPPLPQLPPFPPFPPIGFPFPPLPPLPPLPRMPPFPPFPPLPQLPPFPPLPSLPFPFHFPPMPFPTPPASPFPFPPSLPLPPNPHIFTPSPPTPPHFSLTNPRTWFPFLPPSPPNNPQSQHP